MNTANVEDDIHVQATAVRVSADELTVDFDDGRTLSTPLAWYPRLYQGTKKELRNFQIGVAGIHWPDLDEDLSYRGMLLGRKSGESSDLLKFWHDARAKGKQVTLEDFVRSKEKQRSALRKAQNNVASVRGPRRQSVDLKK